MRLTLLLVLILTRLLSYSQPLSTNLNGVHGYFFADSLAYKLTDSLLTLKSLRVYADSLETRQTQLDTKLGVCEKLDRLNTRVIEEQKKAIEADKTLLSLNNIEMEYLKNDIKVRDRKIKVLKLKSGVLGVAVLGVGVWGLASLIK